MERIQITKKKLLMFIKYQISTNECWALRALEVIYSKQESDERLFNQASKRNNWGFDKIDAKVLSPIAERQRRKLSLSNKDINVAMSRMKRYSRQLYELSDKSKLESLYRKYVITVESDIENVIIK